MDGVETTEISSWGPFGRPLFDDVATRRLLQKEIARRVPRPGHREDRADGEHGEAQAQQHGATLQVGR